MTIKVFDFFSGCGGTSAGLRAAGMEIAFALDNDPDSAQTYRSNFPEAHFEESDIQTFQTKDLLPFIEKEAGNVVLFSGCAPCQPFSKQNRSRDLKTDDRANLLKRFGDFVSCYRPDYVLIENVPGIQEININSPGPLPKFQKLLRKLGYHYDCQIVRAQDYGVPQRRARLILIAAKNGLIKLPKPTHGSAEDSTTVRPYTTAWEAIKHLPPIEAGSREESVPNHICASLSKLNMERIINTPAGGDRRDWPDHLQLTCHRRKKDGTPGFSGHMDVYGRIRKDQPATGLTTRCISLSNGRFGHPEQNRALSVREAACLQTFPENFVFCGTLTSTAKQVGNAVPVAMAKCLGQEIIRHQAIQELSEDVECLISHDDIGFKISETKAELKKRTENTRQAIMKSLEDLLCDYLSTNRTTETSKKSTMVSLAFPEFSTPYKALSSVPESDLACTAPNHEQSLMEGPDDQNATKSLKLLAENIAPEIIGNLKNLDSRKILPPEFRKELSLI